MTLYIYIIHLIFHLALLYYWIINSYLLQFSHICIYHLLIHYITLHYILQYFMDYLLYWRTSIYTQMWSTTYIEYKSRHTSETTIVLYFWLLFKSTIPVSLPLDLIFFLPLQLQVIWKLSILKRYNRCWKHDGIFTIEDWNHYCYSRTPVLRQSWW